MVSDSVMENEFAPLVPVTVKVALVGGPGVGVGAGVGVGVGVGGGAPPPPPPQELITATRNTVSSIMRRRPGSLMSPRTITASTPAKTQGKVRKGFGCRPALAVFETVTLS